MDMTEWLKRVPSKIRFIQYTIVIIVESAVTSAKYKLIIEEYNCIICISLYSYI